MQATPDARLAVRKSAILLLLAAGYCVAACSASNSAASRLAAQNALFEEYYQADLLAHPERATAIGDYRYNDRLDDYSPAAILRQHERDESYLARLNAIPTDGFAGQDNVSHEVLLRALTQRNANFKFKEFEMPVNQMDGPHLRLADLPLSAPLDSLKHYEDYVVRLHQIPRVFSETEAVLRTGMADKLMPVKFLIEKIPAQCDGVIAADPFLLPTKKFPASISAEDQQRLTKAIADAVANEVMPAYKEFVSSLPRNTRRRAAPS